MRLRTKLAILGAGILVITGSIWFVLKEAERTRQEAYAAAVTAHATALHAIEDADIATYQRQIWIIERLEQFAGHQVDGRELYGLRREYLDELRVKAVAAFPRLAAKLSTNSTSDEFWLVERLSEDLDNADKARWMEESLPLYERFSPSQIEERRKRVQSLKRKAFHDQWQAVRNKASRTESYTMSLVPTNEEMMLNTEHIDGLREILLDELGARLAPITVLPRAGEGDAVGKGHVRIEVAATYVVYGSTPQPIVIPGGLGAVPEAYVAEITITPAMGGPTKHTLRAKHSAPERVAWTAPVMMRENHFQLLAEQLAQQIRVMPVP